MNKKELTSFNQVVRDIASLPELSDEALETVVGGKVSQSETCNTDRACEPDCRCNNLA